MAPTRHLQDQGLITLIVGDAEDHCSTSQLTTTLAPEGEARPWLQCTAINTASLPRWTRVLLMMSLSESCFQVSRAKLAMP